MQKIKIEKYIDNKLDESFNVRVAFINVLNTILPSSALEKLNENGFDVEKITHASKQNQAYQAETVVREKGISKKIGVCTIFCVSSLLQIISHSIIKMDHKPIHGNSPIFNWHCPFL